MQNWRLEYTVKSDFQTSYSIGFIENIEEIILLRQKVLVDSGFSQKKLRKVKGTSVLRYEYKLEYIIQFAFIVCVCVCVCDVS